MRVRERTMVVGVLTAVGSVVLGLGAVPAHATITPATASMTLNAGASGVDPVNVNVPSPIRPDIEIAIDTTGSMGGAISQAKSQAISMVNTVQAQIPTSRFAVVDFKDSTDGAAEYVVKQSLTTSATAVSNAINTMSAAGGGDTPEAHNLVFRNSWSPATGGAIGWASNTTKVVVVISDAEPHGARNATLNCNDLSPDPHAFATASELASMQANGRILFMVRAAATASTSLACYQGLAAQAAAGSQGADLSTNLGNQLVALLNGTTTFVNNLNLSVVGATPSPANASWVTSYTPAAYTNFVAPATKPFNINVTVPPGTPGGTYTFTFKAFADSADVGTHVLTITVPRQRTVLTLKPAIVSVTIAGLSSSWSATEYVLTANATLTTSSGAPVVGRQVSFDANAVALGTQFLCTGTTNSAGAVTCSVALTGVVARALATGYDGYFSGDGLYLPSSDHGPLVDVNGMPFP